MSIHDELVTAVYLPIDKMTTLFDLIPTLDDPDTPREQLINTFRILRDYFDQVVEALDLDGSDAKWTMPMIPFSGLPDSAMPAIRRALVPLCVSLVRVVCEIEMHLRCARCGAEWSHAHPLPADWASCAHCQTPPEKGE